MEELCPLDAIATKTAVTVTSHKPPSRLQHLVNFFSVPNIAVVGMLQRSQPPCEMPPHQRPQRFPHEQVALAYSHRVAPGELLKSPWLFRASDLPWSLDPVPVRKLYPSSPCPRESAALRCPVLRLETGVAFGRSQAFLSLTCEDVPRVTRLLICPLVSGSQSPPARRPLTMDTWAR